MAALYDNVDAAQAVMEAAPELVNEVMTSELQAGKNAELKRQCRDTQMVQNSPIMV